ncbi:MAG: oxygen-independent coproporphyrinogen III oxidase, partial [Actinomycetota bacterium]
MIPVTADLIARHDRPGPRYTSYPTALEFDESYGKREHREVLRSAAGRPGPLSLYVHLPFCQARCSFCACHVVVTRNEGLPQRYRTALQREAATVATHLGGRRELVQYHWGGGTPTFFSPEEMIDLHRGLLESFTVLPNAELSIEVDPRVTTAGHLSALRHLGFNRISAGVQDVNPRVQELIGRRQTHEQTARLLRSARAMGFPSINLDLVYGLPGQTTATMANTLEEVLELRPERLAAYSFAYVPWMRRHQRRIDPSALPDPGEKLEMLAQLIETLTSAGYAHVGMDHFARRDDGLATAAREGLLTRNFMGYATTPETDVVALGTSGISDLDGVYAQNHRRLASYLEDAAAGELTTERGLVPTFDDRIRRYVIDRLMCAGRVRWSDVSGRFGVDAPAYFAAELESMTRPDGLVDEGLASLDGQGMRATDLGRLFMRRLAMTFDAYLPSYSVDRPRFSRTVIRSARACVGW